MEPSEAQIEELRTSFLKKLESEDNSTVHPADMERVKGSDDWLRRFLLHHDLNQEAALKMLWDTVLWRKKFGTNDLNESNIRMEYLLEGSVFSHGRDKDGCALFILKCKKHVKGSKDFAEFQRCLVYWFERLERQEKGKAITLFFDMDGCGLSNMDMEFIQYLIGLCKLYYPFFLNYIIVFEMAWILNAAFKVIKTWLPEKAIEKIKSLKKAGLAEYVPLDQALTCWGGTNDYTFTFEPETNEKSNAGISNNRKVHFADGSPMSETAGPFGDKENDGSVLSINPPNVMSFIKEGSELVSTLELQNTDSSAIISYKLKTTSPEKFRVRPSVGSLGPGDHTTISVTILPGFELSSRDKFRIMSMPIESLELSANELSELWKNVSSKNISQHSLRCTQGKEMTKNGNAFHGAGQSYSEQNQGLQFSPDFKALTECHKRIENAVKRLQIFQGFTIVLIVVIGVLLTYMVYNNNNSERTCYKSSDSTWQ